jgi:hypothetical protein
VCYGLGNKFETPPPEYSRMNLDLLKRTVGFRVQLEPPAIHLDKTGRELGGGNQDWIVQSVDENAIQIGTNEIVGLTTRLGKDHIHHFTSNPARSAVDGLQYGFLSLMVQLFIQADTITYRPCSRPGERVAPLLVVEPKQKWVNLGYPVAAHVLNQWGIVYDQPAAAGDAPGRRGNRRRGTPIRHPLRTRRGRYSRLVS